MKKRMKYNDEDMVIPVFYKEEIVAYAPDDFNAKVFKFINEEEGPSVFGTGDVRFVSFHMENDKTKLSHWYVLDQEDIENFQKGRTMWVGDIRNN